jgi:hypothetical protein
MLISTHTSDRAGQCSIQAKNTYNIGCAVNNIFMLPCPLGTIFSCN